MNGEAERQASQWGWGWEGAAHAPCCTCSWGQGPYLSFTQIIGDEPDEDWPGARVGQGG